MKKFAIIGSGALGTALGKVLIDNGEQPIIYGIDENEIKELKEGKNTKYYNENIKLPKFRATTNIKEAVEDVDYIVMAIPSHIFHLVLDDIKNLISNKKPLIISFSKGFYSNTSKSLHAGVVDYIKENNDIFSGMISVSGPSFAEEIIKEAPTIICAIGHSKEQMIEVQNIFQNNYLKIYRQSDIKGTEIGSTFKNVIAIAAGMLVEMGYGINTISALLSRGIKEMIDFTTIKGGEIKTIAGLTGVGDLILTCMSDKSRNRQFGREFIRYGKKALATKVTTEGVIALGLIHKIAKEHSLNLTIVNGLFEVLFNGADPKKMVESIISKPGSKE